MILSQGSTFGLLLQSNAIFQMIKLYTHKTNIYIYIRGYIYIRQRYQIKFKCFYDKNLSVNKEKRTCLAR